MRYTRYVDGDACFAATHGDDPAGARALAGDPADDVLLVCPGIVYRRDAIDRLHTGTPHQLDLWRIRRRPLGPADLDEMSALLGRGLCPGAPCGADPRVHPYTLDGRQVDVAGRRRVGRGWRVRPGPPGGARRAPGLAGRSGLALGMGLDRLLMLRKGIPDIRLLRSDDPRVADQLHDLAPYRPVSAMPPILRDLSVAVDAADAVEDLGDRVREALGADADAVEAVDGAVRDALRRAPAARPRPPRAWSPARRTCWSASCCATSSAP